MSIGMFLDFPSLLCFPHFGMVRIFGQVFHFWEIALSACFFLDGPGRVLYNKDKKAQHPPGMPVPGTPLLLGRTRYRCLRGIFLFLPPKGVFP